MLSDRISAASVAMLDGILYRLASPLAREIIDSLRTEPGEWRGYKSGQGVVTLMDRHEFGSFHTPESHYWGNGHWMRREFDDLDWHDRLALRRAVNKWRKAHGTR